MSNHLLILFAFFSITCNSQTVSPGDNSLVGGPCEGCEAIYEYDNKQLNPTDTLPGFLENDPKLLVTGTVYTADKKSPASDVIVYIYHTNREGFYETRNGEQGWGQRHGYIRGWIKTRQDGGYSFYTFRPASYPDRSEPEHIHMTIKEPGINEYYIDDIMFDDDPLLTLEQRSNCKERGGSGIVVPESDNELLIVKRDIILGLNIPGYPK